ncbi:MAG: DUF58 domain-containing protein [bacterium]|nr:DUF58 domain-containing protein [bacterium]
MLSVKGSGIRMGEHVSRSPGYSPVILDYRHYRSGDPVKDIDWKLSARTEKLFIKIREGYRQTDFVIAVDDSESMKITYNSNPSKFTTGLTMAYIAARIALKSRDRVFFIWNGEKIQVGSEQSLVDLLVSMENENTRTDFWDTSFESGANIFIISDFFVEIEKFLHFARAVSHQSMNIYSFIIQDPVEKNLDFKGRFRFLDPESSDSVLRETGEIAKKYHSLYHEHFSLVASRSRSFGIKSGIVLTDTDPFNEFIRILS